jgi:hypothetical protein
MRRGNGAMTTAMARARAAAAGCPMRGGAAHDDEEARVVSESGGGRKGDRKQDGMELGPPAMEAMASALVFPR